MNLQDKRIAVTGAFGSLGLDVALAARKAGASVACIDRVSAQHVPAALSGAAIFADVDLSTPAAADATFDAVSRKLGGLDALVNIAGSFRWEKVEDGSIDTWDFLHNVNVRTAFNASRAALKFLGKQSSGRIVNIGAAGAIKAGVGMGAYAASKAGVAKLTEALAEELKDRHITVNAVLPSIIDTPANRKDMPQAEFDRWVKPQQVADLILFLLSDSASAITGALIPILGRV